MNIRLSQQRDLWKRMKFSFFFIEKLSMDLSSEHFDTSIKASVIDTELLDRP